MPPAFPSAPAMVVYRLAPAFVARVVGSVVVVLAVVVGAATAALAVAGGTTTWLLLTAAVILAGVLALGWWLTARAWVMRCTPTGYRVRLVRGAGVREARWTAVEDAVTTMRHGVACVVLRLRDGATTTIPAGLLAVDREQFVRELQGHLQRGHGLRPL